ncbi:MAG: hypothetical protein IIB94_03165 [Candidatus Marinimicrobia bacterium]|nr:hypothetical protein [Candidatus Neomarinimicrobiota bacterium]
MDISANECFTSPCLVSPKIGSIEMGIQLAKKLIADESDATALDYEVKEISY